MVNKQVIKINNPSSRSVYSKPLLPVQFLRDNRGIYLALIVRGSTLEPDKKGVTIFLDSGMKISKPQQKISVEYDQGYVYMAYITLTTKDIKSLSKSAMKSFQLYTYKKTLNEKTKNNALRELRQLLKELAD